MFTSWSAFILPSTSASCPTPSHPIQPHTMIFPPPNLTVLWISLSISLSPTCFHSHYFPSDPSLLILVSSDQTTLFQSSIVHSWYFKAKAKCFFLCIVVSNGLFFFVTALSECLLRTFLTVCEETGLGMMVLMCLVARTALAALQVVI